MWPVNVSVGSAVLAQNTPTQTGLLVSPELKVTQTSFDWKSTSAVAVPATVWNRADTVLVLASEGVSVNVAVMSLSFTTMSSMETLGSTAARYKLKCVSVALTVWLAASTDELSATGPAEGSR